MKLSRIDNGEAVAGYRIGNLVDRLLHLESSREEECIRAELAVKQFNVGSVADSLSLIIGEQHVLRNEEEGSYAYVHVNELVVDRIRRAGA